MSQQNGVVDERVAAARDEDVVVFHVGMRINAFWRVHRWLPIFLLAPRMVRALVADDDSGLLDSRTVVGPGLRHVGFVQYWESFEALRDYARDPDGHHPSAWQDYYRDHDDDAAVGIWHETYLVDADEFEAIYNGVPSHGLGACEGTDLVPATDRHRSAAGRLGRTDGSDAPGDASDAG